MSEIEIEKALEETREEIVAQIVEELKKCTREELERLADALGEIDSLNESGLVIFRSGIASMSDYELKEIVTTEVGGWLTSMSPNDFKEALTTLISNDDEDKYKSNEFQYKSNGFQCSEEEDNEF